MKYLVAVGQVSIFYLLYLAGEKLVRYTVLPIPGNVAGLVLLYGLMAFKVIRLEWINEGGELLLKNLNLFFIPTISGVILWTDLLVIEGPKLFVVILVSTFSGLYLASFAFRLTARSTKGGRDVDYDN